MNKSVFIFGIRAVIEAIEAGKDIDRVLVKKDMQGDLARELFTTLRGTQIPVQRVPVEKLNRITVKNHQGVIAFMSAVTYQHVEDLVPTLFEEGRSPFFVMLDGVTDVRNFGAIARTCDCARVDAVIIPTHDSVSAGADAMKTSAGALHTLPVCREGSLTATIKYLKQCGFRIMGAEDTGIPAEHLALCDDWIAIPQYGHIGSLNVSVAAGILIYEVVRQRTESFSKPY